MIKTLSIGTAWAESDAFVRRERHLLIPLVLALMIVPIVVAGLIQPSAAFVPSDGIQPWVIVFLIALVIALAGQMAVMRLALGWQGSLGGAIGLAFRRLPRVLAALVIFFLIVSLTLIPLMAVFMLLSGGADNVRASAFGNLLSLVAIVASIPKIILAPAIAVEERVGPWTLIKRSWQASRGQYWRLLGFFFLFFLASVIFASAVSAVVGSIATLALGRPEPMTLSRLVVATTSGFVQGLVATFYAAMIARMTVQLRDAPNSGT